MRWNVVTIVFVLHFLIQNENYFNKHACTLIQLRSHILIGLRIAAVVHKNRDSSRTATWKLKLSAFSSGTVPFSFATSNLLTISSRALPSEYYTLGTGGLEVLHKCYNTDMLGVLPIYPHSPMGAACPRES